MRQVGTLVAWARSNILKERRIRTDQIPLLRKTRYHDLAGRLYGDGSGKVGPTVIGRGSAFEV
jgi:hypothetical protein